MRSFEKLNTVPMAIVKSISFINKHKGKQALFIRQSKKSLNNLQEIAKIQSVESSNRIEGIKIPGDRFKELMKENSQPTNRSEAAISGYRDVINTIHESAVHIPIKPQIILQLHRDMYKYLPEPGGVWKQSNNNIEEELPDGRKIIRFQPLEAHLVPTAMDELCTRFKEQQEMGSSDELLLICSFILDFLCIHPFSDGNGRMSRLLTLLLLCQAGFEVVRFISQERIIEDSKETYYDALFKSSQGWHKGVHNPLPWTDYSLGTIISAYKEFESRVK